MVIKPASWFSRSRKISTADEYISSPWITDPMCSITAKIAGRRIASSQYYWNILLWCKFFALLEENIIHDVAITGPSLNMGNLRTDVPKNTEGKGHSPESLLMENMFIYDKSALYKLNFSARQQI